MNMHITQFYCFFINIMFLVEFICHQKCTSWRKLHFSACCTNDIFVDIFQNMVNIYYFGWFFVSFKSPLLFLVLLCCITGKSSAKNGFCCVSNKNYCKTRKRPRSSTITGQRAQFSHLFSCRLLHLLFGVLRILRTLMEWNRTLSHDCSELLWLPQLSSWGSRTEHVHCLF